MLMIKMLLTIDHSFYFLEFLSFSGVTSLPSGSMTLVLSICCLNPSLKESKYCLRNLDCSLLQLLLNLALFSFC